MKKTIPVLCSLFLAPLAHGEGNVYHGVIDGRIHALITVKTNEGQYRGQIYYDASGADGLELAGKAGPPGSFEWRESLWNRDGGDSKPTGAFSGTLSPDGKSGQGVWKSADGKKSLPLTLTRLAKIQTVDSKEADAYVDYPQFDDPHFARLNGQLSAEARKALDEHVKSVKDLREEMKDLDAEALKELSSSTDCAVESATPAVVSLLCTLYEYSGGAHGSSAPEARNYAVAADGAVRPLGLWDVLQKSPANVKTLSGLIVADLKRQKASSVTSGDIRGFVEELNKDELAFTVVPAGLAFHFGPYEVASYAEGSFRTVIPNRSLAPLYRRDGPLAAQAGTPKASDAKPAP
jgi:hypothetical protein